MYGHSKPEHLSQTYLRPEQHILQYQQHLQQHPQQHTQQYYIVTGHPPNFQAPSVHSNPISDQFKRYYEHDRNDESQKRKRYREEHSDHIAGSSMNIAGSSKSNDYKKTDNYKIDKHKTDNKTMYKKYYIDPIDPKDVQTILVFEEGHNYSDRMMFNYFRIYGKITGMFRCEKFTLVEFNDIQTAHKVVKHETYFSVKLARNNIYYNNTTRGVYVDVHNYPQNTYHDDLVKDSNTEKLIKEIIENAE
jgi:hypothetical protein